MLQPPHLSQKINLRLVIVCFAIALANVSHGQEVGTSKNPTEIETSSEIRRLIRQLDANKFQSRELAHRKLVEIGKPAVLSIRAAQKRSSAEVRCRAKLIFFEILGRGLVLHLPMEEGELSYRRTTEPSLVADQRGNKDSAIHFPGNGYLVVKDSPELDTDEQFTLAAWIRPTKITYTRWKGHEDREDHPTYPWGEQLASWEGHFIACKWSSQGYYGDYIFAITPSGRLGLGVADRQTSFVADSLYTEEVIPINQWVHVAATFDRGTMKLFINGKLACEKKSSKVQNTSFREYSRDDIYIGDFWNNQPRAPASYNFHGSIDEFCIFRLPLSEEEIQHVMEVTQ